jgi:3-phosphoshikimate 1-carboxyvinyltransferase
MNYLVKAPADGKISASIQLPASKSISNRILMLNALSNSPYEIKNLSQSDDTQAMRNVLLHGNGCNFDIGAAGTAMRFLTAFLSKTAGGEWTLTGTERMRNRPIKLLVDALNTLGARIEYIEKEGFPPLRIIGSTLQGGEVRLSGGISSQYISALLMVAPLMEKGLILHLEGEIVSAPYINLTIQLMKQFGAEAGWEGQTLRVTPGEYSPVPFTVESDWSAASYWYAMAALSQQAEINLKGLHKDSLQGDAAGAALFARLGVETMFGGESVALRPGGEKCNRMMYDFVNEPDLAQTFITTCIGLDVPFRFTGLQSLKIKETDRIEALKTELRKLGYLLADRRGSILEWNGERCDPDPQPVIQTYEDHRMAMAFAPLALVRPQGLEIERPQVVTKSYPAFWNDLQTAGFELIEN